LQEFATAIEEIKSSYSNSKLDITQVEKPISTSKTE
jgi:hypothetical protein